MVLEIGDTKLYFTALGLLAWLVFYLPVVGAVLWALNRWVLRRVRAGPRWAALGVMFFVFAFLPYVDVYLIGAEASRLCREQGGLHVYRTVEGAKGFYGTSAMSIQYWSKHGFEYIEYGGTVFDKSKGPFGDFVPRYWRAVMKDGKRHAEPIPAPTSKYAITGDSAFVHPRIKRMRDAVRDRETGEVLGELVYFLIDAGILDQFVLGLSGFTFIPWKCGDEVQVGKKQVQLTHYDLIVSALKPAAHKHGG